MLWNSSRVKKVKYVTPEQLEGIYNQSNFVSLIPVGEADDLEGLNEVTYLPRYIRNSTPLAIGWFCLQV